MAGPARAGRRNATEHALARRGVAGIAAAERQDLTANGLTKRPTMRRVQRLIAASVLIAFCGALAGCSSLSNFDPTDLLDFLDTKKKLPGERKPVFPDGVPGLEQGVPKDMYKGAQQDDQSTQVATAPPPPPPPQQQQQQ